ncbi:peroxiredoxin-like family protein [Algivirga pacifica]|uniref:thioredoxin-dependent peroxiredoxin n=1 Tax=Algivirga pacifica TaxID=1162670 RepID=A0ABP9DA17_9BACT
MTFQEKLQKLKEKIESNLSQEQLSIMHGATQKLKDSGIQDNVLKVGTQMPSFTLPNQNGKMIDSAELLQKGLLFITFYRGFWCPYCNTDLANLNHYVSSIEQAGGTLLAISPELPEYSQRVIEKQHLKFDILTDKGNLVAEKFGLKFHLPDDLIGVYRDDFNIPLDQYHGDEEWALPMPARFLIDEGGIIQFAESNPDYTQRPDPEPVVDLLEQL